MRNFHRYGIPILAVTVVENDMKLLLRKNCPAPKIGQAGQPDPPTIEGPAQARPSQPRPGRQIEKKIEIEKKIAQASESARPAGQEPPHD